MERNEISLHEVKIYQALQAHSQEWLTNKDIAGLTGDVAERTVRLHTRRLVGLGLLDNAEVFPAHRYRWSAKGEQRNHAYVLRIQKAAEVFGLA